MDAVPSIAHVLMPFSVQSSTLMSVAQYLINEHAALGGRSVAVLSDNRSVSLKDADLRYVDYARECPREWFNRREVGIDVAAGALGLRRPFHGRLFRPAIEALVDDPPEIVLLYEGHYALASLPWWEVLRPRTKIIIYAHNPFSRTYRGTELRRLLGHADGVIFCADHLRQDVASRIDIRLPTSVVHNGVDPIFRTGPDDAVDDEAALIVFAGTIAQHKGPHVLVAALAEAQRLTSRRIRGVIIGGSAYGSGEISDYERSLRAGVDQDAPSIEFLPFLEKAGLRSWFRRSTAVCIPSLWPEGLPLVALEAMACGAPILAADVAGLREACGEAAIYTSPGDVSALAAEIAALVNDQGRAQRYADSSAERAEGFTWARAARQLREFAEAL